MNEHHFQLTKHAAIRMAQRGIAQDDLQLVELIGVEIDGGYFVREKEFQAFDRQLKQLREHAKRLIGKRLVLNGNRIVTAYHAGRTTERRLLRSLSDR